MKEKKISLFLTFISKSSGEGEKVEIQNIMVIRVEKDFPKRETNKKKKRLRLGMKDGRSANRSMLLEKSIDLEKEGTWALLPEPRH